MPEADQLTGKDSGQVCAAFHVDHLFAGMLAADHLSLGSDSTKPASLLQGFTESAVFPDLVSELHPGGVGLLVGGGDMPETRREPVQ